MASSRNIIVSGAAKGIGRCLARHFLSRGHKVFLIDIDEEELKYTANVHLKEHAAQVSFAVCDLRSVDSIREAIAQAANFFDKRIDVLINNGGIATPQWKDGKSMDDPATLTEWQAFVETNLTAPFLTSQACLPFMRRKDNAAEKEEHAGPCIIHVGSFRAHQSDPDQEGYASTKSGQLGLMHSMAITCSRWGIRVNLVAPGRIKVAHESREGDEEGKSWKGEHQEKDVDDHPANRAGTPEDIAEAVEYLMLAGFVTGQELTVDGGALKKKN